MGLGGGAGRISNEEWLSDVKIRNQVRFRKIFLSDAVVDVLNSSLHLFDALSSRVIDLIFFLKN